MRRIHSSSTRSMPGKSATQLADGDTVACGRIVPTKPLISGFIQRQRRGSASAGPLPLRRDISCRNGHFFHRNSLQLNSRQLPTRRTLATDCCASSNRVETNTLHEELLQSSLNVFWTYCSLCGVRDYADWQRKHRVAAPHPNRSA
jgi:hypothetical protein